MKIKRHLTSVTFVFTLTALSVAAEESLRLERIPNSTPRNIILILTDDHRYDALGFAGHPFLETPHMDRMARGGVYLPKAFVTTSLCSPSRASILTGMYAHRHQVVDNYNPVREDLIFFPQYLQSAGYETAFIGKWHMGGQHDDQQRGFDHWVSFKGQGMYWADGRGQSRKVPQESADGFNVNGRRVPQRGYITDELTDYAIDWLTHRTADDRAAKRPFFLYLSHKAVHSDFVAADRHRGRYQDQPLRLPPTFADTPTNYADKPMWLKNQRNSRHGVDFGYNLTDFDLAKYYRRYCETLLAVDDSLGRIMDWLAEHDQLDSTLLVYLGDNGFQFGEHGLIDKRTAYEASIRVPLIMHCPALLPRGRRVEQVVANIDIAPTLLEAAGLQPAAHFDGQSFLRLAKGETVPWRDYLLYEYYWERNYPQTPTMHALRGARYKYIRYHGIWDMNELYDLQTDPHEQTNLIREPEHAELVNQLNTKLFDMLEATAGTNLPLLRDRGNVFPMRNPLRAKQAEFPPEYFVKPSD